MRKESIPAPSHRVFPGQAEGSTVKLLEAQSQDCRVHALEKK